MHQHKTYLMSQEVKYIGMKQLLPTSGVESLSCGADPPKSELKPRVYGG